MINFFKKVWLVLVTFVTWIISIVTDLSTVLREGGKGTPISSRRVILLGLSLGEAYVLFETIKEFGELVKATSIYAALVFIPLVIVAFLIWAIVANLKVTDIQEVLKILKGDKDGDRNS